MRLLVARCEVRYTGRLTAVLPEAVRLLILNQLPVVQFLDGFGSNWSSARNAARAAWLGGSGLNRPATA